MRHLLSGLVKLKSLVHILGEKHWVGQYVVQYSLLLPHELLVQDKGCITWKAPDSLIHILKHEIGLVSAANYGFQEKLYPLLPVSLFGDRAKRIPVLIKMLLEIVAQGEAGASQNPFLHQQDRYEHASHPATSAIEWLDQLKLGEKDSRLNKRG